MALHVKVQILGLDIPVRDTLRVEVLDTAQDLAKTALDLLAGHAALLDGRIQIASSAVLHDLAPVMLLVLHQVDRLDDVDVMQGGGDAELGGELLDVLLFRLVLASLAELL